MLCEYMLNEADSNTRNNFTKSINGYLDDLKCNL